MTRPTIRAIILDVEDDPPPRDDTCSVKLDAYSTCVRGTERCIAHHSEAWLEWDVQRFGDDLVQASAAVIVPGVSLGRALVFDSADATTWSVVTRLVDGTVLDESGDAHTLGQAQHAAERAWLRLQERIGEKAGEREAGR